MNMLFEEKDRDYAGPILHTELDYEYLDRSSRPESCNVRFLLNHIYSQLPEQEKKDLHARITGRNPHNYNSAVFELLLFGIFKNAGCEVKIHPNLDNSTSRPDFLIKTPDNNEFYLEAVLASEYDKQLIAAEKRKDVVLDSINKIKSRDFHLGISTTGNPKTPPNGRKLRAVIDDWLSTLDPDDVIQRIDKYGNAAIPCKQWCHEGWEIEFQALPKQPKSRQEGERIIGVLFKGARWSSSWRSMRDAVTRKGNHYGELNKPLLIAVNTEMFSLDKIDEMQALFGEEQFIFKRNSSDPQPIMERKPNGAWYGKSGIRYKRVSGVWFFENLNPWNITTIKNTIYFNPWAKLRLPKYLKSFSYASASKKIFKWHKRDNLGKIFGLPIDWP